MSRYHLLAITLLLAPVAVTLAQRLPDGMKNADSTGFTWHGYTFTSNVTAYMMMSADMCDIDMAVQQKPLRDWATARSIYANGKYAILPDGKTKMKFKDWTTGPEIQGPYFNNGRHMFGGKKTYISDFMEKVYAEATGKAKFDFFMSQARQLGVMFGLKSHVPLAYFVDTLERLDDPKKFADKKAALVTLDQVFAFYSGVNVTCSPWSGIELMASRWHTQVNCSLSKANAGIVAGFNAAQAAVRAGDAAAFKAARESIFNNLRTGQMQALLFTGGAAETFSVMAMGAKMNMTEAQKAFDMVKGDMGKPGAPGQAAALAAQRLFNATLMYNISGGNGAQFRAVSYTLWRTVGPFVRMVNKTAANYVNHRVKWNIPKIKAGFFTNTIRSALMPVFPQLGITMEGLGAPMQPFLPQC